MNEFIYLEIHSVYSLCEGTIFIDELVSHAKSRGARYLSLCDTNNFYGLVNFITMCRKQHIQPLICSRLINPSFNGILVARTMSGYREISRLISGIHLDDTFDMKEELLKNSSQDYFVITQDRELLTQKRRSTFAEVNVLKKNYCEDYAYAKRIGVEPLLIYPIYFLSQKDYRLHKLLRAIFHNKKLSSLLPEEVRSKHSFPREEDKIVEEYASMSDAVYNTRKIAEAASFEFSMGESILPRYGKNRESFARLKALCRRNLKKRYTRLTPQVKERLQKELSVIHARGYSDYFLLVHDIVKHSPYTCGRGSAAASLVSYLLGITHVDPIRHNLFFERFLNRARPDPPDIDIDFPWDTREEILDYIFTHYSDRAAMVSNHITFSTRSSIREVAKVHGVPEEEIKSITKNIHFYYNRDNNGFGHYSLNRPGSPFLKKACRDAEKLRGRPRHLSVHCGGVVITPQEISSYIPVERAAKGVNIIHLEKDQAEDFGFVKIDILGNRSLSVVRDTLELIEKHYGRTLKYEDLNPLDDEKTLRMLASGDTMGVFYVESPAMRGLQKKTKRGDYEHLVIHSSIIRPAANIYIREYIRRLRGKSYTPLLPEMGEILEETYGIMCYQEDITKIAHKIADLSLAEAEELRKVISKKNKQDRKSELKEKFYVNLQKKNIRLHVIDQVWNMIESFSGYSFCKPHSASYALLSFKACYLKAHYPAEFMGAVLKNQGGYYSALAYISEARRLGLRVVKPDINISKKECFGYRDTIYMGFIQIKSLPERTIRKLVEERETHGPYRGLYDFMKRTGAGPTQIIPLIKAECFRSIERYNQPQLLYMTHRTTPPPALKDISHDQRIMNELELFGFIVSIHPMEYYRKRIENRHRVFAKDLPKYVNRYVETAGILITAKTVLTKQNRFMQFISFEDETAIFETVFFPRVYERHALGLSHQQPYILKGKVESEFDTIALNVYDIERIDSSTKNPSLSLQTKNPNGGMKREHGILYSKSYS